MKICPCKLHPTGWNVVCGVLSWHARGQDQEWGGLPQGGGGSAFLSSTISATPLEWPPHTCKGCTTATSSKRDKSKGISQDKDLEEASGKGESDGAEARPRSTALPSLLGYPIAPEPSTQRHWIKSYRWRCRCRPSIGLLVSSGNITPVAIQAENHR